MNATIFLWVLLAVFNIVSMFVLTARMAPLRPRGDAPAPDPPVRLPRGFGIGCAYRRYVQAAVELRQARPEAARWAVAVVWNDARAALQQVPDRAAEHLSAAEALLDGALNNAGRPDLKEALHRRAWRAAVRLWSARGYPW